MGDAEDVDRELLRGEVVHLVRHLHSERVDMSRMAASRLKDLVLASNPAQRRNQDLIAGVDGAIDGLVNIARHGSKDGKYFACYALAQMAWSNQRNSVLIPSTPGSLDALAMVLDFDPIYRDHQDAREYAAITIGNCGANSEEGAETIVRHAGMMKALISCLANGLEVRMQETTVVALKNCAASSQEAAYVIAQSDEALALLKDLALQDDHSRLRDVAVGAINSISRSPRAVPRLKKMGFQSEVLCELLWTKDNGAASDLRKLTLACAVVNIEASDPQKLPAKVLQRWILSKDGKQAMANMVKCLGYALGGEQWNNVSFSPHSVVCPLFNLTRCFPSSDLGLDDKKLVMYISQLMRESQRFSHWKDNMHVAIKILENLSHSPVSQILMRGGHCMGLLQTMASTNPPQNAGAPWFPPHPSPEDLVAMRRIQVQADKMAKKLLTLPIAVCMGQHVRLGRASILMGLDDAVLQMIVVMALYQS